jgi:hypothetical protein
MATSWERDTSLDEKRSSPCPSGRVHPPRMMASDNPSTKRAPTGPEAASQSHAWSFLLTVVPPVNLETAAVE